MLPTTREAMERTFCIAALVKTCGSFGGGVAVAELTPRALIAFADKVLVVG